MDPRLEAAVAASVAWYDDVMALHGVPTARDGGLWRALAPPPPFHSVAKTLRPGVDSTVAVQTAEGRGGVADSYADLDLPGFTLLFEATWLHRAPAPSGRRAAGSWVALRTPELLTLWSERHDYVGVLPPAVLDHRAFAVLGRFDEGELVGGAVVHAGPGSVDLSNTWAAPGRTMDWEELVDVAQGLHPGHALTCYAHGEELSGLLGAGFEPVGPQRVWVPGS